MYFFTAAFYPLDSFSAHAIYLWGMDFPTAEHAFQWKKFSVVAPDIAARILAARSPDAVKEISDASRSKVPADWVDIKVIVMQEIFTAKAQQHQDVRDILKKTNKRQIIDNAPLDSFWGVGPNKDGQNMIGKLWMQIRDAQES